MASSDTPVLSLIMELTGASTAMTVPEFEAYAKERLTGVINAEGIGYVVATMYGACALAGMAIKEWAKLSDRDASDLLGAMIANMK